MCECNEELTAGETRLIIKHIIKDGVLNMWAYDRKDDEEMPKGSIEKAVKDGIVTIDEMVEWFREEIS